MRVSRQRTIYLFLFKGIYMYAFPSFYLLSAMKSLGRLCQETIYREMNRREEQIMRDIYHYTKKSRRDARPTMIARIVENLDRIRQAHHYRAWTINSPPPGPQLFPVDDLCVIFHLNEEYEHCRPGDVLTQMDIIIRKIWRKHRTALRICNK